MNPHPFPAAPPRSVRAFTLVEMVITLAIFVLLAGAVFGIVTGVLKSAGVLQDDQNRRDEIMALQEFLKTELNALPGKATLNSYRRGDGEGLPVNGIIFGTAGRLTAIDAKTQPNGLYTLRVARFSHDGDNLEAANLFNQAVTGNDDSLNWRELVRDVRLVGWKFMGVNATQWSDDWVLVSATKPNLIEFSIQVAGEQRPTVTDLWIPPIVDRQLLASPGLVPTTHAP
jgi:prepilin-type N-terminal cleavage/methylation domain-containing protein